MICKQNILWNVIIISDIGLSYGRLSICRGHVLPDNTSAASIDERHPMGLLPDI